jgi:hypothetical protein
LLCGSGVGRLGVDARLLLLLCRFRNIKDYRRFLSDAQTQPATGKDRFRSRVVYPKRASAEVADGILSRA